MNNFNEKCKIVLNEELGRYVIAVEDIKAGETILVEQPILIIAMSGDRRCANCFKLTTAFCSICQVFPLCSECPQHNAFDCNFFEGIKNDLPIEKLQLHSEIYGVIKSVLLKENSDTDKYFDELLQLESHLEERRNTEIWNEYNEKVVLPILNSNLTKYFKRLNETKSLDEELLQILCGLIDVNSFEIRAPDVKSMRGVYLKGSILPHQCVANTAITIDDQYQMKIFANRDIKKDEIIYNCYTNVLLGTEERREILKSGKYFHCHCERCEDPTELGSHMSSFVCSQCVSNKRDGFIVQKQTNQWQCTACDHTLKADYIKKVIECAKEQIFHAKDDIYHYEMVLAKLSQILHRNHYIMVDLKQNIAAILRSIIMNLAHRPGRKVYERKVYLCQDILMVLRIIQPGISRMKAITLYELSNSYAELSRLRFNESDLKELELLEHLKQTEAMLRESIRMLLFEPVETPEGKLAKSMLRELKDLQNDMKLIQEKTNN